MRSINERATEYELQFIENNTEWAYADTPIDIQYSGEKDPNQTTMLDFTSEVARQAYIYGALEERQESNPFWSELIRDLVEELSEYVEQTYGFGKAELIDKSMEIIKSKYGK